MRAANKSQASFLISLGAGVNLVVLAILLPTLSVFLLRRMHLHEMAKDKRIAQICGICLTAGSAMVFLAKSWITLTIGETLASLGYSITVPARSIVTGMVERRHLGALYMVISVLTYASVLGGGPLFASTFKWGMQLGDFWAGMPFLIAGGCFLFALLAVSVAARPNREQDRNSEESASRTLDTGNGAT
jgi:MFS family permease